MVATKGASPSRTHVGGSTSATPATYASLTLSGADGEFGQRYGCPSNGDPEQGRASRKTEVTSSEAETIEIQEQNHGDKVGKLESGEPRCSERGGADSKGAGPRHAVWRDWLERKGNLSFGLSLGVLKGAPLLVGVAAAAVRESLPKTAPSPLTQEMQAKKSRPVPQLFHVSK